VTATGETSGPMALRDPDVRLMLRVRADEPGAFAELVGQFQHRLVAVMHHLVGDAAEAEDLAQEVFFRVYRARKKYHPQSKFSTWLFTIANNLARNSLRSRQRKPVSPLVAGASESSGPQEQVVKDHRSGPMQKVQRKELAALIQEALAGLSERQRVAVILNKFEDMSYLEIAEVMGLTAKAVKSLLSRARVNLRAALAPYVYMDGAPALPEADDETGGSSEVEP